MFSTKLSGARPLAWPRLSRVESIGAAIGHTIYHLEEVTSTNVLMAELVPDTLSAGTVILADHQTAGRGKQDRPWFSIPGSGLCLSVLLQPRRPIEESYQITPLVAVAVADAIAAIAGVDVGIKWPNDILVDGRKLCGILCELVLQPDGETGHVIVGIGLNVAASSSEMPDIIRQISTSVSDVAGRNIDRLELLEGLLKALEARFLDWENNGFASIRNEWIRRSCTLGQRVTIDASGEKASGIAVDLCPDGSLDIRDDQGRTHNYIYGETSFTSGASQVSRS